MRLKTTNQNIRYEYGWDIPARQAIRSGFFCWWQSDQVANFSPAWEGLWRAPGEFATRPDFLIELTN